MLWLLWYFRSTCLARPVTLCCVKIMLDTVGATALQNLGHLTWTEPFAQPEAVFLERVHDPLEICIALGVMKAGTPATRIVKLPGWNPPKLGCTISR